MADTSVKRVAWITGASKGIGRAVALHLAARNWTVAASARNEDELAALSEEAASLAGSVKSYPLNITDKDACAAAVKRIEDELGPIEWALMNAGTYIRFGVADFDVDMFRDQIEINLMGTVLCLDPIMKRMVKRRRGRLGVVSSVSGYQGLPFASAYGASKAALINMCESMRVELERKGVILSVVNPGFVRTPLTDKNEFPMPFLMDADEAAERIVDGMAADRFEIAFPTRFVLILKALGFLPYWLFFKLTRRMM